MLVMPHFTFHGFRYICVEGAGTETEGIGFYGMCNAHRYAANRNIHIRQPRWLINCRVIYSGDREATSIDVPDRHAHREMNGWAGRRMPHGILWYSLLQFSHSTIFPKMACGIQWRQRPIRSGAYLMLFRIFSRNQAGAAAWSDAATIIP